MLPPDPTYRRQDWILDRFIPPRSLRSSAPRLAAATDADGTDPTALSILEKDLRSDRRHEYRRLLADALFGERRSFRVLPLGLGVADGAAAASGPDSPIVGRVVQRQDWPVRARRDPLVGAPEMKVALPELPKVQASRARMDQLMAWGNCGILAVAGRRAVYLWRRPVESNVSGTAAGATELLATYEAEHRPMALCWSPSPERALLAISTGSAGQVQIWDCKSKTLLFERQTRHPAPINVIAWHPSEDIIAMGSCLGYVFIVTTTLSLIKTVRVFDSHCGGGLSALAFSNDGVLLACGGTAGTALVWDWDTGVVRGDEVDYCSTVTSLSWHPWRCGVVAVGTLAGDIALLNFAARRTTTASYRGAANRPVAVTALSFSQRTAELVVAFAGRGVAQVAVLSDLTTVVDRLKAHQDSVNYICWSPDGAILATGGSDEMLCMWNFLGAKTTKELRRRALQESREDRSGIRRQFGCIIR